MPVRWVLVSQQLLQQAVLLLWHREQPLPPRELVCWPAASVLLPRLAELQAQLAQRQPHLEQQAPLPWVRQQLAAVLSLAVQLCWLAQLRVEPLQHSLAPLWLLEQALAWQPQLLGRQLLQPQQLSPQAVLLPLGLLSWVS